MLTGRSNLNIDAKGRMNFPAKFREELGECFYVTCWLDDCLAVFDKAGMQNIVAKLSELSAVEASDLRRYLFGNAEEVTPDKQGRILLPAHLREYAGLTKNIVVSGSGEYAEIWDKDAWEVEQKRLRDTGLAARMKAMNF